MTRGQPYLTEADEQGRRSGTVFLGLRDAAGLLDQVRAFDGNATLAIVPLSTVYLEVSKSASQGAAARDAVPQPRTSTSSDLRLFRLQPLIDERSEEAALVPGSGAVPLFYEPALFLTDEAGGQRRPYFLRSADLLSTWERLNAPDGSNSDAAAVGKLRIRVVALEKLLQQVEAAELDVAPLLMPPSETAEVLSLPRRSN